MFQYTVDPNADEPIMLLNTHIGFNDEDGQGIDGAAFERELLTLDSMDKKRIQVWICCPGGSVIDGMKIVNAILQSKTPVDTYNTGICASMGAAAYSVGRKRYMADYAKFMVHNPSGGDDKKALAAFTDSVNKMMGKSKLSTEAMQALMDKTTWMNADECYDAGICTEKPTPTSQTNIKHMGVKSVAAMMAVAAKIVNTTLNTSLNIKPNKMKKVTAKLGLTEDANEESVLAGIGAIEAKITTAEARATAAETALQAEKDNVTGITAKLTAAELKVTALEKTVTDNAAVELKEKATAMVIGFSAKLVTDPKSTEGKATIDKWVAIAEKDMEGTEEILKNLPVNKISAKIVDVTKIEGEGAATVTAQSRMMEIAARTAQK